MKQKFFILFLFTAVLFFGQKISAQAQGLDIFRQEGIASWYGREFDGRPTASGEIYDSSQLTAAHPNLPFGTMLTVTNRHNNRSVTVRVNDRGPFVAARIIDVSRAAAEQLDMIVTGTAPVTIESIERIVVTTPPVETVFSQPSAQTPSAAQTAAPVTQTQSPSAAQAPVTQASSNTQAPIVTQPAVTQMPPAQAVAAQTASDTQSPVTTQPSAQSAQTVTAQPASAQTSASANANVQQPVNAAPSQIRLIPENMTIAQNKVYRLQVGSYKVARNAVDAFERLKNAGLNPAYERFTDSGDGDFFRVVLAGVLGTDVQSTTERLWSIGFREAIIREEQ